MKNNKDIIAEVKSHRDVMSVEERRDVMLVEERLSTQPKSRRDVMSVETPTVIREILRYGLTFGFVQYPYHVPTGLWWREEMHFYPHDIPNGIDFQGCYVNLSSRNPNDSIKQAQMTFEWLLPVRDASFGRKMPFILSSYTVGMRPYTWLHTYGMQKMENLYVLPSDASLTGCHIVKILIIYRLIILSSVACETIRNS